MVQENVGGKWNKTNDERFVVLVCLTKGKIKKKNTFGMDPTHPCHWLLFDWFVSVFVKLNQSISKYWNGNAVKMYPAHPHQVPDCYLIGSTCSIYPKIKNKKTFGMYPVHPHQVTDCYLIGSTCSIYPPCLVEPTSVRALLGFPLQTLQHRYEYTFNNEKGICLCYFPCLCLCLCPLSTSSDKLYLVIKVI